MRGILSAAALVALTACAAPMGQITASPAITAALDSQADGYVGSAGPGTAFQIVSTSVSNTRLCRVVTIEGPGSYDVESFCKAPGGSWR